MNNAFILPRSGRFWLCVQSPNGTWMILEGGWITIRGAKSFAERAGYVVMNTREGLALFEQQYEARAERDALYIVKH